MLGELEFILSFKIKDPKHPKHCLAEVEVARVVDEGGVEVLVWVEISTVLHCSVLD
jgi:hypothetical protein